ncbi:hypothetical protein IPG36_04765 [bacterium]|nr:MAG: hypothetical protein IPG36_04765 [bacterium]
MKQPDMSAKVMHEIESQHIKMRPRWHFILLGTSSLLGIVGLSGLSAYLINVMTLSIRIQSVDRPMYGARQHLSDLLAHFPWWALIVAILAIIGLVWLLRQNSRLYRVRIGWIIALVLSASIVAGLLISISPLGQLHNGQNQNTPRGPQWQH